MDKIDYEMWGAVLHAKWKAGTQEGEIIHTWAEDFHEQSFMVPPQIRGIIIHMQNWLSEKYIFIDNVKQELSKLERFFE